MNDVPAYMYQADLHCGPCIVEILTGVVPLRKDVEEILDLVAEKQGVDRHDERTYDSGDFPKVVIHDLNPLDQDDSGAWVIKWDHCGSCQDCLDHDLDHCRPEK